MLKMTHLLLGAAAVVGIASATTARAQSVTLPGSTCIGEAGNVQYSGGTIFNAGPGSAQILCVEGQRVRDVRRMTAAVFDSNTSDRVSCVFWGESFGQFTFGPTTRNTSIPGTGQSTLRVSVSNSNQTRAAAVRCYLPPPGGGVGSGLFSYTITTR